MKLSTLHENRDIRDVFTRYTPRQPLLDALRDRDYGDDFEIVLPISSLTATQETLSDNKSGSRGPVTVAEFKDRYYVIDGHHRVADAVANGHTEILCKVWQYL